jgi:large conductance mechanosensitive channel
MGFVKEFKEFISRGNLIELATAVVIGASFGAVSGSLVNDILMPPLSIILGKVKLSEAKVMLHKSTEEGVSDVTLNYGNFLQNCINFLLVSLVIFIVIKAYNKLKKSLERDIAVEVATPAAPPAPSKEEILLTEIRDLLAKR